MTFEGFAVLFLTGALMGAGILLHFWKMGIKRVLGYDIYFDIFLSILLGIVFHGTQGGMMLAIVAGIMISVVLRITRWFIGYEQLHWVIVKTRVKFAPMFSPLVPHPALRWVQFPPKIQFNK
jgi:hypothetical protein